MPTKKTKRESSQDMLGLIAKIIQDSAVTIFWESVDRFKNQAKLKLEISLKFILSTLIIIAGLIFVLVGVSGFLDQVLAVNGIGYILTGVLAVIGGVWLAEKAKEKNE